MEGWMKEQMNRGTRVISQDAVPLTKNLMAKKPSFGPNFGPIDQNLGSK